MYIHVHYMCLYPIVDIFQRYHLTCVEITCVHAHAQELFIVPWAELVHENTFMKILESLYVSSSSSCRLFENKIYFQRREKDNNKY